MGSKIINPAFTDQVGALYRYTQEETIVEWAKGRLEVSLGRPVLRPKTASVMWETLPASSPSASVWLVEVILPTVTQKIG